MKAKCDQLEVERDCLRREADELRDLLKTARCAACPSGQPIIAS